jgi:hypothetical protein
MTEFSQNSADLIALSSLKFAFSVPKIIKQGHLKKIYNLQILVY